MRFWRDDNRRKAAERSVRLQVCFTVLILDSQVLGKFNVFSHSSRNGSSTIQSGMDVISPNKTRFSPESLSAVYKAHIIFWTWSRQPEVEGQHAAINFITSIWHESDIVLAKLYNISILISVTILGVITADVNYNFTEFMFILNPQFWMQPDFVQRLEAVRLAWPKDKW